MHSLIERRSAPLDLRLARSNGVLRISGYAVVFNSLSEDLGGFREMILPGAFTSVLGADNVRLLVEHKGLPLADTRTGSLRLCEDAKGLAFTAEMDQNDPDAARVIPKLERGLVRSMSFGFKVARDGDRWERGGVTTIRKISRVQKLFDVSLVGMPAYAATSVQVDRGARTAPAPQRDHRRRLLQLSNAMASK